tara:strand:- start:7754 stop:8740 length:987 start_codon:yes stop_codon:yes gene_type:complete
VARKSMTKLLREYISEVITTDTYADTYRAGEEVHRDQRRRSGEPYYEHPKAVRNIMRKFYPQDRIGQLAALLHDALEDYEKGGVFKSEEEVLERIGQSIKNKQVKDEVIRVVKALTHDKGVDYSQYVTGLSGTSLRVKLADMLHNISSSPSEKQKLKYKNAINILLDFHGGTPPGIDQKHLDAILNVANDNVNESMQHLFETPQGAGIIVVNNQGLFLGLKIYGKYDIPKGRMDANDGGSHFETALREAEEEANISVLDFKWGNDYFDTGKTRCWLAETDQTPEIKKNPETGEYEHHGWEWVPFEKMTQKCHAHLRPAIEWAQGKLER